MSRISGFYLVPMLVVMLAGFSGAPNVFSQYAPGGAMLKGTVKSSDGKPMEGVTVSVRGEGKTFVTSVFTDEQGSYLFPRLEKNKYKLWAQAVGFEAGRADVDVTGSQTEQVPALELKPLKDFHKQLSAIEWIASLPEKDSKDVRMKAILVNNCTGCHQVGWVLQSRLDATGWATIINMMATYSSEGWTPPTAKPNPVMVAYKEELAGYLAKVRGPGSPLVPKVLPRITGEATKAVITEYDLPRTEVPSSILKHDGSDWSEGTPGRYAGRAAHDVALDRDGNVYWADDIVPGRTFGKLDPKTGEGY